MFDRVLNTSLNWLNKLLYIRANLLFFTLILLIIVYIFTKKYSFLGELLTTAIIYPFKSKWESEGVNKLVSLVQKYR